METVSTVSTMSVTLADQDCDTDVVAAVAAADAIVPVQVRCADDAVL